MDRWFIKFSRDLFDRIALFGKVGCATGIRRGRRKEILGAREAPFSLTRVRQERPKSPLPLPFRTQGYHTGYCLKD